MGICGKTRVKLADRAGWSCGWCAQKTRRDMGWQNSATIEHMTPKSQGGTNKLENLMSACARCNRLRGTQAVDKFREIAATFEPDRRLQSEALHQQRKVKRQARQAQLTELSGKPTFSYVHVPDEQLNAKERLRKDRTLVRQALQQSLRNPFEPGSRRHVLFNRELDKLPTISIWSQVTHKLTVAFNKLYSAITCWEKRRENCIG